MARIRRRKKVKQMSKYTTEVRYICEMKSGFPVDTMDTHTPDEIIAASRSKIFDFSYPIYEAAHKPVLETKILKHYYTREIGAETVGLWKLWLNDTLNLIMPKYNRLYEAEALNYQKLLNNIDVTFESDRDTTGTEETQNLRTDNLADAESRSRETKDRFSDTPQGTIMNVDNDSYLTDYRRMTETESGQASHTGTQRNNGSADRSGTEDYLSHETGYRGSKTYYELLADYNDKILNIDMMIVNDLADCFFKLW